jgi:tRNA nucleotidyltransferase (CCA-adding enzyme)
MKRYLVGGAVRDALLGLPVKERDWGVSDATPDELIAAGYRPVGRDFPVFLHPQTKEEHALARSERKSAPGYHGFVFHTGPEVTLEDDLQRRDLTVNAIAQDQDGRLIDPYGGRADLQARLLRHVSPAFAEDPVRILRVARFAARFEPLGFRVADQTLALMRQMVASGEADHLVPERVWKETERALMLERPSAYFKVLRACGALARVMPELDALAGVPQRDDYHAEIDTLVHVLMGLDIAAGHGFPLAVRTAVLLHDLGKAGTPTEEWPSHRMHDVRGVPLVERFCARLRVPNAQRDLARSVAREHLLVHRARELRPNTLLELLERLNAFRKPVDHADFFDQALDACLCDARGRLGQEQHEYAPVPYLREARHVAAKVQATAVLADGIEGARVGEELHRRRVRALQEWRSGRISDGSRA